MTKYYSVTIRIISTITLIAFVFTQTALGYEKMGTVPNKPSDGGGDCPHFSHLRLENPDKSETGPALARTLGGKFKQVEPAGSDKVSKVEFVPELGESIIIFEGELTPLQQGSLLMTSELKTLIRPGMKYLDMGTGTGIHAFVADKIGAVATAVDVETDCAELNNEKLGHNVDIRQGDLFAPIHAGEKFDVISFAPPQSPYLIFGDIHRDEVFFDPEYKVVKRFLVEAGDYILNDGVVLLLHSAGRKEVLQWAKDGGLRLKGCRIGSNYVCYRFVKAGRTGNSIWQRLAIWMRITMDGSGDKARVVPDAKPDMPPPAQVVGGETATAGDATVVRADGKGTIKMQQENIVPVITPLTRVNGVLGVDRGGIGRYIKHLVASMNVVSILICGATGEFHLMSMELRQEVIRIFCEEAKGQLTLFTNVTGDTEDETFENARIAKDSGADAIVICPLFYLSSGLIESHVKKLKEEIGLPVILYNNPGLLLGCGKQKTEPDATVKPEVVERLWNAGLIAAIKDSSGRMDVLNGYVATRIPVYQGDEGSIKTAIETGALGAVGSSGSVSSILQDICDPEKKETRHALQQQILGFRDSLIVRDKTTGKNKIPAGLKYVLNQTLIDNKPICEETLVVENEESLLTTEEKQAIDNVKHFFNTYAAGAAQAAGGAGDKRFSSAPMSGRLVAPDVTAGSAALVEQPDGIEQQVQNLSDLKLRDEAEKKLVQIGAAAIPKLWEAASSDKRIGVRLSAVKILGGIPELRSIEPLQTIIQTDAHRAVRSAAKESLRRLLTMRAISGVDIGKREELPVTGYSRLIVTDLHGDYDVFSKIRSAYNHVYPDGRLICLGDYGRKGPQSIWGAEGIFNDHGLADTGEAVALIGNHEMEFLTVMLEKDITKAKAALSKWMYSTGKDMLREVSIYPKKDRSTAELLSLIRANVRLKTLAENMSKRGRFFYIEDETLFVHSGLPVDMNGVWVPYEGPDGSVHAGPASLDVMQRDLNSGRFDYGRYFDSRRMPYRAVRLSSQKKDKFSSLLVELNEYFGVPIERIVYGHFQDEGLRIDMDNRLVGIDVYGKHAVLIFDELGAHAYIYEDNTSQLIGLPERAAGHEPLAALGSMAGNETFARADGKGREETERTVHINNKWSKEKIIKELKIIYASKPLLHPRALARKYPALVQAAASTRYFGSLRKACEAAEIEYNTILRNRPWSQERIILELTAIYKHTSDFRNLNALSLSKDHADLYKACRDNRYFGSYRKAFEAVSQRAGWNKTYDELLLETELRRREKISKQSPEEILEEIRRIYREEGGNSLRSSVLKQDPERKKFYKRACYRFKYWRTAVETALPDVNYDTIVERFVPGSIRLRSAEPAQAPNHSLGSGSRHAAGPEPLVVLESMASDETLARADSRSELELKAEAAFKKMYHAYKEELEAIRKYVDRGEVEESVIEEHEINMKAALNKAFNEPSLNVLKLDIDNAIYIVVFHFTFGKSENILHAVERVENALEEVKKLADAGRLLDIKNATVSSGIADVSRALKEQIFAGVDPAQATSEVSAGANGVTIQDILSAGPQDRLNLAQYFLNTKSKINADITQFTIQDLASLDDGIVIEGNSLGPQGQLVVGDKPIIWLRNYAGHRVVFEIKQGWPYRVWVFDDNAKLVDFIQLMAIYKDDETIERTSFSRLTRPQFNKLRARHIIRDAYLDGNGLLNIADRNISFGKKYARHQLEIEVRQGQIWGVKIIDRDNNVLKDAQFALVYSKGTDELVYSFYRNLTKKRMQKYDNITIKKIKLNENGALKIGGKKRLVPHFSKYPKHQVELDVIKGQYDKVRILDEQGDVLLEHRMALIYNSSGELIDSFWEQLYSYYYDSLEEGALITRLGLDIPGGVSLGSRDDVVSFTGSFTEYPPAEYPDYTVDLRLTKNNIDNTTLIDEAVLRNGLGNEVKKKIYSKVYDENGKLIDTFSYRYAKEKLDKLKKAAIKNFRLDNNGNLSLGTKHWASFTKYPGHEVNISIEDGVVTHVDILDENKLVIKVYDFAQSASGVEDKGEETPARMDGREQNAAVGNSVGFDPNKIAQQLLEQGYSAVNYADNKELIVTLRTPHYRGYQRLYLDAFDDSGNRLGYLYLCAKDSKPSMFYDTLNIQVDPQEENFNPDVSEFLRTKGITPREPQNRHLFFFSFDRDFQQQNNALGIDRLLWEIAFNLARHFGGEEIKIKVPQSSINFYENFGFSNAGHGTFGYIMSFNLAATEPAQAAGGETASANMAEKVASTDEAEARVWPHSRRALLLALYILRPDKFYALDKNVDPRRVALSLLIPDTRRLTLYLLKKIKKKNPSFAKEMAVYVAKELERIKPFVQQIKQNRRAFAIVVGREELAEQLQGCDFVDVIYKKTDIEIPLAIEELKAGPYNFNEENDFVLIIGTDEMSSNIANIEPILLNQDTNTYKAIRDYLADV